MRDDVAMSEFRLTIPATLPDVRLALAWMETAMSGLVCCAETMDAARTILAEVLNNIVEHAYAGQPGDIGISFRLSGDALAFTVTDRGGGLPGGVLPQGDLPAERGIEDLPEGGFGWYLIRLLAEDLVYLRIGGENRLSFVVRRKQSGLG